MTQSTPHDFAKRRFQCRHIFHDGHRCGSPCLRSENFCYYHKSTRPVLTVAGAAAAMDAMHHDGYNEPPNQTFFPIPRPEDHSSVQHAIGTIMTRLACNSLDPRRAGLLLYALQIASGNLKRVPRHSADDIVQDMTLDPEIGALAPEAELPCDIRYRELLAAMEQDDAENDDDDEDDD